MGVKARGVGYKRGRLRYITVYTCFFSLMYERALPGHARHVYTVQFVVQKDVPIPVVIVGFEGPVTVTAAQALRC